MRLKIYRQFGALNSRDVFDAFSAGVVKLGHEIVDSNEDIAVIWSVLWQGRMLQNQEVYQYCQSHNIPVMIIEVGNLKRGVTWRLSLDHINGHGKFANIDNLDGLRPEKLGIKLNPPLLSRRHEILIASQHKFSLQWANMPTMEQWIEKTIKRIRKYSNRNIVVRPHPRSTIRLTPINGVRVEIPNKIPNSYDDFDIDYNFHCVINHNSGPAVQAAIAGTPVICDASSLAGPISEKWENVDNPTLPDRQDWFVKLCHTEWTLEELAQGIPQERLIKSL
jgi:hypothetical protein